MHALRRASSLLEEKNHEQSLARPALRRANVVEAARLHVDRHADADYCYEQCECWRFQQAFLDGDIEKIHATHSDDWDGLLDGSSAPIKGIDEYMRANGIEWPRPANAPKQMSYYPPGTR
jgi:hypothetical protein